MRNRRSWTQKEVAVGNVGKILFELIEVVLASELDGMCPDDFAEVVGDLVDVVEQLIRTAGDADHEIVEINLRDSLDAGRSDIDTRGATVARLEAQVAQLDSGSSQGPVECRVKAEITETELVDRRGAQSLDGGEVDIVGLAFPVNGEPRVDGRVAGPVRVDAIKAIKIVIGRQQSKARVCIHPAAELVVVNIDLPRIRRKRPRTRGWDNGRGGRGRDVAEKFLGDGRKHSGRQLRVRKHALGSSCTSGKVVRFTCSHRLTELLRQRCRPGRSIHAARQA